MRNNFWLITATVVIIGSVLCLINLVISIDIGNTHDALGWADAFCYSVSSFGFSQIIRENEKK